MNDGPVERRRFLETSVGASVAAVLGAGVTPAADASRARVVLVRRADAVLADGRANGSVVHAMLDQAVCALFDEKQPAAAWRRLIRPGDVVGIKSNSWDALPTPPELEEALREAVLQAGVGSRDVAVDDRGVRENPVFARATALLNVRPMRTHAWSGLGTCLKNMVPFAENPPDYHPDGCADLGALWRLPLVAGKVRLNVLVLLTPQFHGVGPHSFAREYTWPYGGLAVSVQPVPVDSVGARIVQAKRRLHFGSERPLSPSPHHIEIADRRYGLGPSDPSRIDLVRLGSSEGALV